MLSSRAPLTHRAPLPPLPPLETAPVSAAHIVRKAIAKTSPKEKNDLTHAVSLIWQQQHQEIIRQKRENIEKGAILRQMESQMRSKERDLQLLSEQTQFYLNPSRLHVKKPAEYFVESIREAEALRNCYQPVGRPELLDELMSRKMKESDRLFKLYDLLFARLEEAAYTYSNRLSKLQDSIETEFAIKGEFASSSDLFNMYTKLTKENRELIEKEARIVGDSFVKRRKSKDLSLFSTQTMIPLLQEMITKGKSALEGCRSSGIEANLEDAQMDFDSITNDKYFQERKLDFADSETNDISYERQMEMLNDAIGNVMNTNNELQEQIDAAELPNFPNEGTQKYEKTVREFKECNRQLLRMKQSIEDSEIESTKLAKEIRALLREKIVYENRIPKQNSTLNELVIIHSDLVSRMNRNKSNIKTLCSFDAMVGNSLGQGTGVTTEFIQEKVLEYAKEIEKEKRVEIKEPAPDEKEQQLTMHQKLHFRRKNNRRSSRISSSERENKILFRPVFFTRPELTCALSTIMELGQLTNTRSIIHDAMNDILSTLSNDITEYIQQYQQFISTSLNRTRILSNTILVKEKLSVCVQATDENPSILIQTDEPEPPHKRKPVRGKRR